MKARPSRIRKPHTGTKHPGIYGKKKEITPCPKSSYILARFSLPMDYALALQKKYPDKSLNLAVKMYLLDTLIPDSGASETSPV